jgi:hypothetical protein
VNAQLQRVKYIADNLSKNGWSYGCLSAIDSNGRTIWITDAHRDNGKNRQFKTSVAGKRKEEP